jgi:hypothetical protein
MQMWQRWAQARCRCGQRWASPGADVAEVGPFPAQMWLRTHLVEADVCEKLLEIPAAVDPTAVITVLLRAGTLSGPGADVAAASPVPVQMWHGASQAPLQMWHGARPVPVQMWQR